MSEKSILITGCSSGIGYDAAHGMAARGWRVFATCRAEADCVRLRAEGLESFVLDYDDEASIGDALTEVLNRTGGTLDALFNNGAYAIPGAVEDVPRDAMRAIFETNLFGYHDLTCRVLPIMRAQGHGRIVNCSSILGFVSIRWRGAYTSTKFALEGLSETMAMELRGTGISVSLIEPGPVTSSIRANAARNFEKWIPWETSAHSETYRNGLRKRLYAPQKRDAFELPASAVTKVLIHAVESRRPKLRYYVTTPTWVMAFLKRILPVSTIAWLTSKA